VFQKIPHFTYCDELDVTELLSFRKEAKLEQKHGIKVTYMPFVLKAVSQSLLRFPKLNAQVCTVTPYLLYTYNLHT